MELRHLRYFIAVAEEENVSKAALRLHVSQPGVSRQVRDLEEELGFALFERTAKSIRLTEAGGVLFQEAKAILEQVEQAIAKAKSVSTGEKGQLRIGYAPSLTIDLLPKALRKFSTDNPGVRIQLHDLSSEECVTKLRQREIEIALTVRQPSVVDEFEFEELTRYPVLCVVPPGHRLARKKIVEIAELRKEKIVIYSKAGYPEAWEWLNGVFKPFGFQLKNYEEQDGASGLMTAVECGAGIAIVAASFKSLSGSRLKFIPLSPAPAPLKVGALFSKNKLQLVERFLVAARP